MQIEFIILLNVIFLITSFAYMVKSVLWFRSLILITSVFTIIYSMSAFEYVIWTSVGWNLIFIAINLVHIILFLREKHLMKLNEIEAELYNKVFSVFSKTHFRKLFKQAKWSTVKSPQVVLEQGSPVEYITYIYKGKADILKDGVKVVTLSCGSFVGEMSYITSSKASATVVLHEDTRMIQWKVVDLKKMSEKLKDFHPSILSLFSIDMAVKLKKY